MVSRIAPPEFNPRRHGRGVGDGGGLGEEVGHEVVLQVIGSWGEGIVEGNVPWRDFLAG